MTPCIFNVILAEPAPTKVVRQNEIEVIANVIRIYQLILPAKCYNRSSDEFRILAKLGSCVKCHNFYKRSKLITELIIILAYYIKLELT